MTHRPSSSSTPMATRLVNIHTHTRTNQALPPLQARGSALFWRVAMALLPVKHRLLSPTALSVRVLHSHTSGALLAPAPSHTYTHTCTLLFSGKLAVHSRCNTGPISFPLIVAPKQLCGGPWLLAPGFHLGSRQRKAALRVCWGWCFISIFFHRVDAGFSGSHTG